MKNNNFFNATLTIFILLITPLSAEGVLRLNVNPLSGGNNLRFGRINSTAEINEEVKIRITSTDGKAYQVFQRIEEPFLNEKQIRLETNIFKTYTISGSNSSGSLYLQQPENIGYADQLLYSSSSNGEGDSFTIVYAIDGSKVRSVGSFLGKILYTIRPIGGTAQDTVFLNVSFEISGKLKVTVVGSMFRDKVLLNPKYDYGTEKSVVQINFEGNRGQNIKIFQEIEIFPHNELLEEVNQDVIQFQTSDIETKGKLLQQNLLSLQREQVLLYTAQTNADIFRIIFSLNKKKLEKQKAGRYKGKLKYIVEVDNSRQIFPFDFELEIEPVFDLQVNFPPGGVSFPKLLPMSPPQIREVEVFVKSNMYKPYVIMQKIISPLVDVKGKEIQKEYFSIKGFLEKGNPGKVAFTEFTPIDQGDSGIYFSDNKGSSARFKIMYRLRPFPGMEAGDYTTNIIYSLGEK
ncbi:hypothetical protein MNBD_UNCLBAC01-328 [hydrothermal vent metagenome]|uniref:Uncharacterized protein n=1 Tax=hydrothermal vent metagenome TaxID=652676 RepID=A0A3B1DV39_9ZZZZ